jgi:hypothetical protein
VNIKKEALPSADPVEMETAPLVYEEGALVN